MDGIENGPRVPVKPITGVDDAEKTIGPKRIVQKDPVNYFLKDLGEINTDQKSWTSV